MGFAYINKDIEDLIEKIDKESLLVCSDESLKNYLKKNVINKIHNQIISFVDWLKMMLNHIPDYDVTIISTFQEKLILGDIYTETESADASINIDLIRNLYVYWNTKLLEEKQNISLFSISNDIKKNLLKRNMVCLSQIPDLIFKAPDFRPVLPFKKIFFFAFIKKLPKNVKNMIHKISKSLDIYFVSPEKINSTDYKIISFDNRFQEITEMCKWAISKIQKAKGRNIPKITCVFSDEHSIPIAKAIANDFLNEKNLTFDNKIKFLQSRMILDAFKVIRLNVESFSTSETVYLAKSKYLNENFFSKQIPSYIKSFNLNNLSLEKLNTLVLVDNNNDSVSIFFSNLKNMFEYKKTIPKKNSISNWINIILTLLGFFGWPGKSLSDKERSCFDKFNKIIKKLIAESTIVQNKKIFTFETVIELIKEQLNIEDHLFAEGSIIPNLNFVTIPELLGRKTDFLWIMNLNEQVFNRTKPNAQFLVEKLKYEMWNEILQSIVIESFPNVILSYSKKISTRDADINLVLKDLIYQKKIKEIHYPIKKQKKYRQKSPSPPSLKININTKDIGCINCNKFENISDEISEFDLYNYIYCPFVYFAKKALSIKNINQNEIGIAVKESDLLIKNCLDAFWMKIKSQENLIQIYNNNELEQYINESINESETLFLSKNIIIDASKKYFLSLEKEKIKLSLFKYAKREMQRPAFKVAFVENPIKIKFSNINMSIKIDRIDITGKGNKNFVIYRSSGFIFNNKGFKPQYNNFNPRIYYSLCESDFDAISYLSFNDFNFHGISKINTEIPGIKYMATDKWDDLINEWREGVAKITNDFYYVNNMDSKIDSRNCLKCKLSSLCRIFEDKLNE